MILKNVKKFEYVLFFLVILISFFGLVVMYSSSSYYAIKRFSYDRYFFDRQLIYIILGIIIMLVVSNINYKLYSKISYVLFIFSISLVVLTILIGTIRRGSIRWIQIGSINIQTSEIVKLSLILFLSNFISRNIYYLNDIKYRYRLFMIILVPFAIVSFNNLSTGIIIFIIGFTMYYVSSKKYLLFICFTLLFVFFYIYANDIAKILENMRLLREYQLERIYAWKNPLDYQDTNYQIIQGLYAIASGGIFGKGLGQSIQKSRIPEPQNDMVFSILCEELGIVGAYIFIFLYIIIIFRIIYIAMKQKDMEAMLICFGVAEHIAIQAILNICVNINLIPNTGVSLPFISYGGSSMIILFTEVAIVMNISKHYENKTES